MSTRTTSSVAGAAAAALVVSGALGAGCSRNNDPADVTAEGTAAEPAAPAVTAEVEPNNTDAQAHDLALDTPRGGDVTGDDVDWYRLLPGTDPAVVVVTADSPMRVEVVVPRDGARYTLETVAGADTEIGRFVRDTPVFVALRGEGAYQLTARPGDGGVPCGFAHEPDLATAPGAVLTALPARTEACIARAGDEDFFVLEHAALASAGAFGLFVSGVPGVSLDVSVQDAQGNVLAAATGGPGRAIGIPSIAAPLEGDAHVRIRSLAGANDATAYLLDVRRVPLLNGVVETEPNDIPVFANVVSAVDLINGYLHRPGDVDYYSLQSAEPRVLRMFADSPPGVDLQIVLDAGTLFGPATIDDTGVGLREGICSIRIGPDLPFAFGIRARVAEQEELQPYLVHFQLYDGTDFEVEPNNAATDLPQGDDLLIPANQALGLWIRETQLGLSASGHIFPPGDVDNYVVEVFADPTSQVTYTSITVRLEPNSAADYTLEILDSEGGVLARSATGGAGEAESVALDLPGGRYMARVTSAGGASCEAPYRLTVAQTEIPRVLGGTGGEGSGEDVGRIVIENAVFENATPATDADAGTDASERPRPVPPRPPTVRPLPPRDLSPRPPPPGPAPTEQQLPPADQGGSGYWPRQ